MDPLEVVTSSAVALLVLKEVTVLVKTLREKDSPTQLANGQSFKCGLEHGVLKEALDKSFSGIEKIMSDQTEILKTLSEVSHEQIGISRRAIVFAEIAAKHAEENNKMLLKKRR